MPRWKVYKGTLRRFEPNPPLKFSFEKCSNLDHDYKWMLKGWNQRVKIYILRCWCM